MNKEMEANSSNENDKKLMDISMSKDSHDSEGRTRRKTLKGGIPSGHDHDVEMSGYLQKRRGGFGRHMPNAWQIRYFTLKDGIMYYYEDSGVDSRPRGKIDLKSENCDFMNGLVFEGAPTPFTMQIIPGGWDEKWKLCATTKEEMELWVAAIMKHITDETKRKPTSIPLKSYVSDEDDEQDDDEAEEDHGPHLKLHGVPVSGGNSILHSTPGPGSSSSATQERFTPPTTPQVPNNTSGSSSVSSIPQHPTAGNHATTVGSVVNATVAGVAATATAAVTAAAGAGATTGAGGGAVAGAAVPGNPAGKSKTKRRLKLQSDASVESDEMEYISVLVIVNLCLLFGYTASHVTLALLYFLILNIILARTLQLRSARLQQQHQNLITTHAAAMKTMQESHHQAIQTLIQKSMESSSSSTQSNGGAPMEGLLTLDALITGQEEGEISSGMKTNGPPPPGTTVQQIINGVPPDVPNHSWNICDHSTFNVRVGPDYSKYKRKGPSAKALYEPFAVDTFCAKNRIDHVAQYIKLENTEHIDTHNEFVPPLLLVQIQLPSDAPPLFETIEDGPGWAIVMYFRITQDTCDQLKDLSTASPAVKLFAKYCQFAETDPAWRGRFKVINFCSNLEEMGVPSVIMSYNAKPVLIRRTGSVYRGHGNGDSSSPSSSSKYLEIDIHVHKFANLAKKSIHALSSRCSLMYMQIGFVIEGRTDEELPETLFACVGVNRPEEDKAEFLFDPPEEE